MENEKELTLEEAGARKVSLFAFRDTADHRYIIVSDCHLGERTLEMAVAEIRNLDPDDDNFPDELEEQMDKTMDIAHDLTINQLDMCAPDDWKDPDKHFEYFEIP